MSLSQIKMRRLSKSKKKIVWMIADNSPGEITFLNGNQITDA